MLASTEMRGPSKHALLGLVLSTAGLCDEPSEHPQISEKQTEDPPSDTRISRIHSSLTTPVGACGEDDERAWLMAATCDDGSHPVHSHQEARRLLEGRGDTLVHGFVDLYRVPCPERSYDVYLTHRACTPGQQPESRHACFVVATETPGEGIDCLTGRPIKLDPDDPRCLQLRLTSPAAREACETGARITKQSWGRLDKRCGPIWGVDRGAARDGPYYYIDERTMRTVARCGGACMAGRCENCPPKEAVCERAGGTRQWQSLYRFYVDEFMATPIAAPVEGVSADQQKARTAP